MAKQLQLRKGTAAEHNTFTGANGEVTVDTTNKTLRVHDGVTVGGTMLVTYIAPPALPVATTSTQGIVKLSDSITNTSITEALTSRQGWLLWKRDFGTDQTWQDLTSSRASGVTYTNTTGKPIQIYIVTGTGSSTLFIDGVPIAVHGDSMPQLIVPHTSSYRFNGVVFVWAELR